MGRLLGSGSKLRPRLDRHFQSVSHQLGYQLVYKSTDLLLEKATMTFSTATTRTLLRFKFSPSRTAGVSTGQHHLRHVSNNTPDVNEQRYVDVAKRCAPHHQGFDLNEGNRNPSRTKASTPPVGLQPILMESRLILQHLQRQHASFLHQNSLTCIQIHRDGTFALSSRIRGWKIW